MTKKSSQQSGAQAERDAILKFVRRRLKAAESPRAGQSKEWGRISLLIADELVTVVNFIEGRTKRFNAKPGGLGKK